jgi:hypothetical protein
MAGVAAFRSNGFGLAEVGDFEIRMFKFSTNVQ